MGIESLQNYIIKDHARFEMQRRQISEEQVHHVLTAPQQIVGGEGGRRIYQSKLFLSEAGKEYLFRMIVDIQKQPAEVVTVYRTSKIAKYWR